MVANMPPIRIFIVEAQPVMLEALTRIIEAEADMAVVGAFFSLDAMLQALAETKPQLILLNIATPPYRLKNILRLTGEPSHTKLVMYCAERSVDYVQVVLAAEVSAYLNTTQPSADLLMMIRAVVQGIPYSSEIMQRAANTEIVRPEKHLTPRQIEVLRHVVRGRTNEEIKDLLNIQVSTVKKHVSGALAALGADNRTEAGYRAMLLGLLDDNGDGGAPDGAGGGGSKRRNKKSPKPRNIKPLKGKPDDDKAKK